MPFSKPTADDDLGCRHHRGLQSILFLEELLAFRPLPKASAREGIWPWVLEQQWRRTGLWERAASAA